MLNKDKPVTIELDKEKCTLCGLCTNICAGKFLVLEDNTIKANHNAPFGCIQCSHCMMYCPQDAIKITGEAISHDDIIDFTDKIADYESLHSLLLKRRSIRKFKNKDIPKQIIDKILNSGATAAIGVPPSEVKVTVVNNSDKVQEIADILVIGFEQMLKTMTPFILKLLKPFFGELKYKFFNDFLLPLATKTIDERKKGNDILFYNAPALILFYSTELGEKEDCYLSAANSILAAESLGLGTCIIGSVPPLLERNLPLRSKLGIQKGDKPAIAFILGYPDVNFQRTTQRQFKSVTYLSAEN